MAHFPGESHSFHFYLAAKSLKFFPLSFVVPRQPLPYCEIASWQEEDIVNSGNLLKHRCPGPFEMACGKWDVHAGLADAAQDLWDTSDLLEGRLDTLGCLKWNKLPIFTQWTELHIKSKAIPFPSLDTHPQSHEPRELLENEDDHNSGIHQLHLMRAFLTSRPITASD